MIKNTIALLKIRHYIKNLVIFLPLIFAGKIGEISVLWQNIKLFIAFCLISSAVYIFNDIQDKDSDKQHPIKKKRPVASGKVSVSSAWHTMIILIILSLLVGAGTDKISLLYISTYFILNVLYSLKLKNIKYVDVFCIAFGFILRVLSGYNVSKASISISMLIMVFLTSIFFTTTKRLLEYRLFKDEKNRRISIHNLSESTLSKILYASAILSVLSYNVASVLCSQNVPFLYLTAILFVLLITRILFLIKDVNNDDPMSLIEKDKQLKILISIFFILICGLSIIK